MTPGQTQGHRIIDIETQKVSAKDLMLAMRLGESQYEPDLPLSAPHPRRNRARRHSAHDRWPRSGREGLHHRSRRPARADSDRSRRDQPRVGRGAPGAGDAVPGRVRRQSHHAARAVRGSARGQQYLGDQGVRRHPRARLRGAGRCQSAHPQPLPAASARRSGQAAHRHRAGRARQHGPRRRAQRQHRFFRRRPAAGARHCRHAHVGRRDEATLAGLRRAESARLGRRARPVRHRRAVGNFRPTPHGPR